MIYKVQISEDFSQRPTLLSLNRMAEKASAPKDVEVKFTPLVTGKVRVTMEWTEIK